MPEPVTLSSIAVERPARQSDWAARSVMWRSSQAKRVATWAKSAGATVRHMKIGKVAAAVAMGGVVLIARVIQVAAARSSSESAGPRTRTMWRWRCECGGKSRYSETSEFLAQCNADRHRIRQGADHEPEVYPTEEEIE